jgi:hypothetical protein
MSHPAGEGNGIDGEIPSQEILIDRVSLEKREIDGHALVYHSIGQGLPLLLPTLKKER